MKQICFSIIILTITGLTPLFAAIVNPETAEKTARNFYAQKTGIAPADLTLEREVVYTSTQEAAYYIFNLLSHDGFVIVAAEDCVSPVLAYSAESSFLRHPQLGLQEEFMEAYRQEITFVRDRNLPASPSVRQQWQRLESPKPPSMLRGDIQEAIPLLGAIAWGQERGWNAYCPVDAAGPGGHVYVGCVATAIGMILRYHQYPAQGQGQFAYFHQVYGQQSVDYEANSYNWAAMDLDQPGDEAAKLLYHLAVGVSMDFSAEGSGSNSYLVPQMLVNHFNYDDNISLESRVNYSEGQWIDLLKSEIDATRPVYYAGTDGSLGHAFVCDGYDAENRFHFNWGWDGSSNGYYRLTALNPGSENFNYDQRIIIGIQPPEAHYCSGMGDHRLEHISEVLFGDISNSSPSMSYTDYSNSHQHTLAVGESDTLIVMSAGDEKNVDVVACWVDWNQDYDFEDVDEYIPVEYVAPVGIAVVEVPEHAASGLTSMRIRLQDGERQADISPCGGILYGETEDYGLVITGGGSGDEIFAPNNLMAEQLGPHVLLGWDAPAASDQYDLIGYTLYCDDQNLSFQLPVNQLQYLHANAPAGMHHYCVKANYDGVDSECSEPAYLRTGHHLLAENFDQTPFPPDGWTVDNLNDISWRRQNNLDIDFNTIDPFSTHSALCPPKQEAQEEWLISPQVNTQGSKKLQLSFYAAYSKADLTDANLTLHISTDGNNWTEIWNAFDDPNSQNVWRWYPVLVDLGAYAGQSIQLAWRYMGQDGATIAIDNVMLTASAQNIRFTIVDQNDDLLSGATVSFNDDTQVSNELGEVYFENVFTNQTLSYTVSKNDYTTREADLYVDQNTDNKTVRLLADGTDSYTVTFTVEDSEKQLIEGVWMTFNYETLLSDSRGELNFHSVPAGEWPYSLTDSVYQNLSGTVSVSGSTNETLTLSKSQHRVSFFLRSEDYDIIKEAEVVFNGESKNSDKYGKVLFDNVLPDQELPFSIQHPAYLSLSDNLSFGRADTNLVVFMTLESYTVLFVVKDKDDQIVKFVNVQLGEQSKPTNKYGEAEITDVPAGEDISYTIQHDDYQIITSTIDVLQDKTINIQLEDAYTITFEVEDENRQALADVSILLNGKELVTDESGLARFPSLPPDSKYAYTLSKAGYEPLSDELQLAQSNLTIPLTLNFSSIEETDKYADIQIYPNPAKHYFYINISNLTQAADIILSDCQGRMIIKQQATYKSDNQVYHFSITNLDSGLYFVQIKTGDSVYTRKLMVE